MARRLAAEGSANFSTSAQLFAGFLTQTAAIIAAWQHGKRFRFVIWPQDPEGAAHAMQPFHGAPMARG